MQILNCKKHVTTVWHIVKVNWHDQEFEVSVTTKNGKMVGDAKNGIATSYLPYANGCSLVEREQHFLEIKKAVEQSCKNKKQQEA